SGSSTARDRFGAEQEVVLLTKRSSIEAGGGNRKRNASDARSGRDPKQRGRAANASQAEAGGAAQPAQSGGGRARIRASHAGMDQARRPRRGDSGAGGPRRKRRTPDASRKAENARAPAGALDAPLVAPGIRKAPLAGPRRAGLRRTAPPPP